MNYPYAALQETKKSELISLCSTWQEGENINNAIPADICEENDVTIREETREDECEITIPEDTVEENYRNEEPSEEEFQECSEEIIEPTYNHNPPLRRSTRGQVPQKFMDDYICYNTVVDEVNIDDVPQTFNQIKNHRDHENWFKAVNEELESMKKNDVWEVIRKPIGIKPLKTKWVFRIKPNEDGKPAKYKARLVVKGFLQKYGIDYEETYAPVAKLTTIRTVLAVGVQNKLFLHHLDVKTAFLHGNLKEEICMEIPEGLEAEKNMVCKLKKSLYGLKQSPRCWNEKINRYLIQLGYERSRHDYCLYVKVNKEDTIYIVLYVDDILIAGKLLPEIMKIKKKLSEQFEMSDCGELKYFLGIKIEYERLNGTMFLSQEANIDKILKKFNMTDCNLARTPMEKAHQIPEDKQMTNQPYRELLGSLMYLMLCVRPDICFYIGYMGRFQQNPTESLEGVEANFKIPERNKKSKTAI